MRGSRVVGALVLVSSLLVASLAGAQSDFDKESLARFDKDFDHRVHVTRMWTKLLRESVELTIFKGHEEKHKACKANDSSACKSLLAALPKIAAALDSQCKAGHEDHCGLSLLAPFLLPGSNDPTDDLIYELCKVGRPQCIVVAAIPALESFSAYDAYVTEAFDLCTKKPDENCEAWSTTVLTANEERPDLTARLGPHPAEVLLRATGLYGKELSKDFIKQNFKQLMFAARLYKKGYKHWEADETKAAEIFKAGCESNMYGPCKEWQRLRPKEFAAYDSKHSAAFRAKTDGGTGNKSKPPKKPRRTASNTSKTARKGALSDVGELNRRILSKRCRGQRRCMSASKWEMSSAIYLELGAALAANGDEFEAWGPMSIGLALDPVLLRATAAVRALPSEDELLAYQYSLGARIGRLTPLIGFMHLGGSADDKGMFFALERVLTDAKGGGLNVRSNLGMEIQPWFGQERDLTVGLYLRASLGL